MDRRLLKITGLTGLGVVVLVTILFVFLDKHIGTAAYMLKDGAVYRFGVIVSLIGDHDLYNVWLLVGFMAGGILALGQGVTPGVRGLLYVCVTVSTVMIIGETLKWFFGRYRPEMHFEQGLYGFSWFASKGSMHSFPSGHSMRVFSTMTALGLVLPRWRIPLLTVAALVGISRVVVTRHYPSDIAAGAFVGVFAALWVWSIMMGWNGRRREEKPFPGG